jgi:hypothetical protein
MNRLALDDPRRQRGAALVRTAIVDRAGELP